MKQHRNITLITLWTNRLVALAVVILLFTLNWILDWYSTIRTIILQERLAITVAFYCCTVAILMALWNMDRLLTSILAGQTFIRRNVTRIRRIQWCCAAVCIICIPACLAYMPLIFVVVLMGFLCLAVSVLGCVMDSAVSLQEESDLTI